MIKNKFNDLYIGITDNPVRRLSEHNLQKGSEFTKIRNNFEIVFLEEYVNITDARKREIQIKKWRRDKKDRLIEMYKNNIETRMSL